MGMSINDVAGNTFLSAQLRLITASLIHRDYLNKAREGYVVQHGIAQSANAPEKPRNPSGYGRLFYKRPDRNFSGIPGG